MAECNNYTGLQINPTPSSIGNQYAGVSTDEKPANAPTYSVYLELDTGKFYYYDGTEWKEVPCCGDGGGSGGGGEIAQVTFLNSSTDGADYSVLFTFTQQIFSVSADPVVVNIPLYDGTYYLWFNLIDAEVDTYDDPTAIAVTGDIIWDSENQCFYISGDGTITIKPHVEQ